MISIEINQNEANQRLDKFLKKYLAGAPLSLIYKIIRKDLKVNGKRKKQDEILNEGDRLDFYIDEKDFWAFTKKATKPKAKRQFEIAYEDENIIIVNKPYGLLTHGDKFEKKNTLANQVISYLIEKGEYDPRNEKTFVPSPSNRLDRNTTGLVIFGKNSQTMKDLNKAIADKDALEKWYVAICDGSLEDEIHIANKMVKDQDKNQVSIADEGKDMESVIYPVETDGKYSIVRVKILTGRTHQIRVHLAQSGHPILGDPKYGKPQINNKVKAKYKVEGQLLHAHQLNFKNCPGSLEYLNDSEVKGKLPANRFDQIVKDIRKGAKQ